MSVHTERKTRLEPKGSKDRVQLKKISLFLGVQFQSLILTTMEHLQCHKKCFQIHTFFSSPLNYFCSPAPVNFSVYFFRHHSAVTCNLVSVINIHKREIILFYSSSTSTFESLVVITKSEF